MLSFRIWLETDVKQWQSKIDQINRQFVFSNWFPPEGIVYLPFQPLNSGLDDDIRKHFDDEHQYTIHDYQKGLLINKKNNQQIKIGKVINREEQKDLKQIEDSYKQGKISKIKYEKDKNSTIKYYQDLRTSYEASPLRVGANNQSQYMIAISSKPEDIAAMSTNRDWTSCVNLSGGMNKESIWCELSNGGFVAYLCYSTDKNIDKPLARIHIRRFDNKKGQHVAMLEDSTYGNEIQGFREEVQKWIDSKQGRVRPGKYLRKGGWYSDTFGTADPEDRKSQQRKDMMYTINPKTGKGLFKLLQYYVGKITPFRHDVPIVVTSSSDVIRVLNQLLELELKLDNDTKEKLIEFIKEKAPSYFKKLFVKYPELATPEDIKKLDYYDQNRIFRNKKDDPKYRELQKEIANQEVMDINIDDPNLKINKGGFSEYESSEEIMKPLHKMSDFLIGKEVLSQPLIRKLVDLGSKVLDKYKIYSIFTKQILKQVMHVLSMGQADTPIVVNFYHRLLPYWEYLDEGDGLGITLGRLGENGKPFLPFLREKLEEIEPPQHQNQPMPHAKRWAVDVKERKIERLNYIIDSIENGTGRSDKYNFY